MLGTPGPASPAMFWFAPSAIRTRQGRSGQRDCQGQGILHNLCWYVLITFMISRLISLQFILQSGESRGQFWGSSLFFAVYISTRVTYPRTRLTLLNHVRFVVIRVISQDTIIIWIRDPRSSWRCKQGTVSSSGLWRRPACNSHIDPHGIYVGICRFCTWLLGYCMLGWGAGMIQATSPQIISNPSMGW